MYQSTYELEKLAEMRNRDLMEKSNQNRILKMITPRKRRDTQPLEIICAEAKGHVYGGCS